MKTEYRILVPRYIDAANTNAQNLNAKALLSRFASDRAKWIALHYNPPQVEVASSPRVELRKLCRTRLWQSHAVLLYQQNVDAIFYPGMEWMDLRGLQLRKLSGRQVPVIGTLEALAGDDRREQKLEAIAGHKIFCHNLGQETTDRIDRILSSCDHIIAITPMLAKLGRKLYGNNITFLPLGIDTRVFHPAAKATADELKVIGVGTLTERKRPGVFLQLGSKFPTAKFVWFGDGPLLKSMREAATTSKLENVIFAGPIHSAALAQEYRESNLLVLPSYSEGAPKVLQEAAACGLPRIAFGFYEPQVANEVDGYVVWSDDEMFSRVSELISNPVKAIEMGRAAALSVIKNDWNIVAPLWERTVLDQIERKLT